MASTFDADMPSVDQVRAARVLVVGDAMLDRYWLGAVDRISPEAPVPVVRVSRQEERLGGAANVAMNIARLGARAALLASSGHDDAGDRLACLIDEAGIEPMIERDADIRTIVKLRVIGRAQQLIRLDFDSVPGNALLARLLSRFQGRLGAQDVVVMSDYGKGALSHAASMIQAARAAGKTVLVDPKGSDYSRYAGASVVTPNLGELAQVIGAWNDEATLTERAQALRQHLRLGALVLTRAEEGMSLFDAEGALHVPTLAREVFDVTGAGDTVIGVLACMMAAGVPLRKAVPIANRAAGLVVARFGTAGVSYAELFA